MFDDEIFDDEELDNGDENDGLTDWEREEEEEHDFGKLMKAAFKEIEKSKPPIGFTLLLDDKNPEIVRSYVDECVKNKENSIFVASNFIGVVVNDESHRDRLLIDLEKAGISRVYMPTEPNLIFLPYTSRDEPRDIMSIAKDLYDKPILNWRDKDGVAVIHTTQNEEIASGLVSKVQSNVKESRHAVAVIKDDDFGYLVIGDAELLQKAGMPISKKDEYGHAISAVSNQKMLNSALDMLSRTSNEILFCQSLQIYHTSISEPTKLESMARSLQYRNEPVCVVHTDNNGRTTIAVAGSQDVVNAAYQDAKECDGNVHAESLEGTATFTFEDDAAARIFVSLLNCDAELARDDELDTDDIGVVE